MDRAYEGERDASPSPRARLWTRRAGALEPDQPWGRGRRRNEAARCCGRRKRCRRSAARCGTLDLGFLSFSRPVVSCGLPQRTW